MLKHLCAVALAIVAVVSAHADVPNSPRIDVKGYVIQADLNPATGRLSCKVEVAFTALEDLNAAVFGLNNALQITSISDGAGLSLTYQRDVTDSTVRVTPAVLLSKGSSAVWTFTYAGVPAIGTSPVSGLSFVQVSDPVSILLYPGRWFPLAVHGLFTDRFTAVIHVTVPAGETVVGTGGDRENGHDLSDGRVRFDFKWDKPGFPGTILAGKFLPPITTPGSPNIRVFVTEANKAKAQDIAATVAKEFEFMTDEFGPPDSAQLNVVELPENSVAASWAPEIVAINPSHANARLLANTVARQWWGSKISPATLNDAWITNGMSRYAELMYVEQTDGEAAFEDAVTNVEAGALAYDTQPLTSLGRLDPFSPQFQSMTLEKGAMVFHMLRWEMGDAVFQKFLQALLKTYADRSIRTADVETLAESISHLQLTAFFSEWLNGTGAPAFTDSYSVFRLGQGKGFRTVGSVSQDLDLFSMPMELSIETEGKTEDRRIDVSGPESHYSIDTFGLPRKITIDPDNWLLKRTPDLSIRVDVLLGQQDVAQGDLDGAIAEYTKALALDRGSSLANFRLAEVYVMQKNYQAAVNSFRDCLRGDDNPKWTEVWSHLELGKIFDLTGQRERAVNEYRLAVQTGDNSQGAVNEARALIQQPYERAQNDAN